MMFAQSFSFLNITEPIFCMKGEPCGENIYIYILKKLMFILIAVELCQ